MTMDEVAGQLRADLQACTTEIVLEIQHVVPEYARPADSAYSRQLHWVVMETARSFTDSLGHAEMDWQRLTDIYAATGMYEAQQGRSIERLHTAMRVGGQVACRRFIEAAKQLGWSFWTLGQLIESLFVLLEKLAGAVSQGYADANERIATERERLRGRLCDLLVSDPPASREAIAELAAAAGWPVPTAIAVVAVRRPAEREVPALPATVLAGWYGPEPFLVVPASAAQATEEILAALSSGVRAAIGPAVPPHRGAVSFRWARRTLALIDREVIAERDVARCMDHVAAHIVAQGEELLTFAVDARLGPLDELPPRQRAVFAHTLLEYMKCRDNAVDTAERLTVHDQTVRYRIRRLRELMGEEIHDPERRTELLLILHAAVEFGLMSTGPARAPSLVIASHPESPATS
ncbi:PucR family transcriptional regulator [Actinomadura sp. 6N118]|uniref:PucR family transcriptional regulator n=1 Tax=Actinomadura sp. 6N118 TaxID=3375151 RepID=UPI0037ABBE92